MILTLAFVSLVAFSKPPIPAAEANLFRAALTEALADPESNRAKLVAQAKALEAKFALPSLMKALREGPKLAAGAPKPRTVGGSK
ncbi:MAG: hypothetical protein SGI72_03720 [Planctomycetota bacterium]|nr:hypothetical protein [Planctomycetota bacterium]